MSRESYRPDIDGLRAVAVLLVVFFHFGLGFSGGYTGVDVFLVISGFLITGIIRKELAQGTFSLYQFWLRRVRRIVPAQLFMCLIVVLVSYMLLMPAELVSVGRSLVSLVFLRSNIYFHSHLGYFDPSAEGQPLLHTWSLSMEEQYYLLFPFLMLCIGRFRTSVSAVRVLSALALVSFAACVIVTSNWPSYAYYRIATRAWEFLLGGLLTFIPAIRPESRLRYFLGILPSVGLIGILTVAHFYTPETRFPGIAALLPCVFAGMILFRPVPEKSWVGMILHARSMTTIGRMSYSIYLWHWPIFVMLHHVRAGLMTPTDRIMALALTAICGWMSWQVIETPVRNKKVLWKVPHLAGTVCICSALLLAFGISAKENKGFPNRLPEAVVRSWKESQMDLAFQTPDVEGITKEKLPLLGIPGDGDHVDFLLWGDSHAIALAPCLDSAAREWGLSGRVAARSATIPLPGLEMAARKSDLSSFNSRVLEFVHENDIPEVFLVSRWLTYLDRSATPGTNNLLVGDEKSTGATEAEAAQAFRRCLNETLRKLRENGTRVWLMHQVPDQQHNPLSDHLACAINPGRNPQPGSDIETCRDQSRWLYENFFQTAGEHLIILDTSDYCFDSSGHFITGQSGVSYFADQHHLSPTGARKLLHPMFDPIMEKLARKKNPKGYVFRRK